MTAPTPKVALLIWSLKATPSDHKAFEGQRKAELWPTDSLVPPSSHTYYFTCARLSVTFSGTRVCMHPPVSHESRNLSRQSSLQSPTRSLTRQERAVDFALGDWALFSQPSSGWDRQFYTPTSKRRRRTSPVVVPEESPLAEAAAVAAFLNSPDAAWNWLPCSNRGVSWKHAQDAGSRLGLGAYQGAQLSSSRSPSPESVSAAPLGVSSDSGNGSSSNPAMVSFDGSIGATPAV